MLTNTGVSANMEPVQHSPGPWSRFRRQENHAYQIGTATLIIARVVGTGDVATANAAVLAAAPELLAALEDCANRFERCCIATGSTEGYAAMAVADYRKLITKARPLP